MADNGTVGRVRTGYVKGTSERMMKLGDEVTAVLKKPEGQVTKKEMDDALAKVDEMRNADPPLDNQEKLNRLTYSNSLADRAVTEGLMTNEQKMARKDTVAEAVAGMYFGGGGGGRMPSRGGGTGNPPNLS
jgi:filamentous hemagglutinin